MSEEFRKITSVVSIAFAGKELEIGIKNSKAFLLIPERRDLDALLCAIGIFFVDKSGYSLEEYKNGASVDLNLFLELMFWRAERQKDTILRDDMSKLRQFVIEELGKDKEKRDE